MRFGLRNGVFPSWLSLEAPAKSFVLRRGSNFIFPAPISCLGIPQPGARLSAKAMPRQKGRYVVARSMSGSQIIGVLLRTVLELCFTVQRVFSRQFCGQLCGRMGRALLRPRDGQGASSAGPATGQSLRHTHYSLAKITLVIQRPCHPAGGIFQVVKTAQSRGRTERTLLIQR